MRVYQTLDLSGKCNTPFADNKVRKIDKLCILTKIKKKTCSKKLSKNQALHFKIKYIHYYTNAMVSLQIIMFVIMMYCLCVLFCFHFTLLYTF